MNSKHLLFLVSMLFSITSFAAPKNFEVWFLSIDQTSELRKSLNLFDSTKYSQAYSQVNLQCQKMGDYCFDPQVGLYKQEQGLSGIVDHSEVTKNEKFDFLPVPKGATRNLISCDDSNRFDIFCGKSKKINYQGKAKLEIWVDTSSTMKQVDGQDFGHKCKRQIILEKVSESCDIGSQARYYSFEVYRKEVGLYKDVCTSGGLNDMKRIIKDVKKSTLDNLIIITDIFEARVDFIDEIQNLGGIVRGIDKPLYARNILKESKRVSKLCR